MNKVSNILSIPDWRNLGRHENMEEDFFEGGDEDIALAQYQTGIKLDALADRGKAKDWLSLKNKLQISITPLIVPSSFFPFLLVLSRVFIQTKLIFCVKIAEGLLAIIRVDPMFMFLVEIRVDPPTLLKFCIKFKSNWEWVVVLASEYSRGMIIIWNHTIGKVTPLFIIDCFYIWLFLLYSLVIGFFLLSTTLSVFTFKKSIWNKLSHLSAHYII